MTVMTDLACYLKLNKKLLGSGMSDRAQNECQRSPLSLVACQLQCMPYRYRTRARSRRPSTLYEFWFSSRKNSGADYLNGAFVRHLLTGPQTRWRHCSWAQDNVSHRRAHAVENNVSCEFVGQSNSQETLSGASAMRKAGSTPEILVAEATPPPSRRRPARGLCLPT